MSSNPLLREPAGGSAFTTMIAPIFSLSSWLPHRRDERPPFSSPASGPLACVDLSMPEGLIGGRGGKCFSWRKLILHSLMLDPKLRQRPTEFLGLRLHPRHFADQVANHADQIGIVKRSNESGGGKITHS